MCSHVTSQECDQRTDRQFWKTLLSPELGCESAEAKRRQRKCECDESGSHFLQSRKDASRTFFFPMPMCVLSGRGLCDGLITRPEESYRLWCFVVCDLDQCFSTSVKPQPGKFFFFFYKTRAKSQQIYS